MGVTTLLAVYATGISWPAVALIAAGSTGGGALGARYGRRLSPGPLRALIIAVGVVAIVLLV